MNIYLVPYTNARHIAVALAVGAASMLGWWAVVFGMVEGASYAYDLGFLWRPMFEGLLLLSVVGGLIAGTSVLAEGTLKRRGIHWRLLYAVISGGLTAMMIAAGFALWSVLLPYLGTADYEEIRSDASLASLFYSWPIWAWAGFSSGFGPFFTRRGQGMMSRFGFGVEGVDFAGMAKKAGIRGAKNLEVLNEAADYIPPPPEIEPPTWTDFFTAAGYHCFGGLSAALCGAAVWQLFGYFLFDDLYYASAFASLTWGVLHGLLCWPIPDNLYAGWVRVLSAERYGLRIPIDRPDGEPSERFIGHFPRGLDMYLPADRGVAELHTSFVVDSNNRYAVRGLSQQPTTVKRLLEKIDLRYDPTRPAPLETTLQMEDRVLMGDGETTCEVEFLLLPKEEL